MPDVILVPGKPTLLLGAYDPATLGYQCQEFFVSGTARSYAPETEADYTTRIVVLTPAESNGTAIVEWLNVSGGIDAPAVWFMAHREIVRAGYAYVGVSAQRVGVEGGVSLLSNLSLKTIKPQRYSPLNHPGDAFSYDIYSQIGRLIRAQLHPEFVLAVGESQSAMFLTTYINEVDPLARVYDGFLVHSRFGPAAPLDGGTVLEPEDAAAFPVAQFGPDLRVPLINVITETDLVGGVLPGYHLARQPDNEWLRTWEIPGTAHADNYTIQVAPIDTGSAPRDDIIAAYAPTNMLMGQQLPHSINFAPQHHYVVQAAIAQLHNWVRTGRPAPAAPPMALSETNPPRLVLDENGLAMGGVRTPWVDVPIAKTSGVGSEESLMSTLFGSGEPFDTATLGRLYPGGSADYLPRFTKALDEAIEAGFLVPADRTEILELAAATYPRGT